MKSLEEYRNLGQALYDALHLSTYPVAITYIRSADEIPKTAVRPSSFGQKMALCQAFTQARRWGSTVAMTAEDNFCTPSTAMHLWEEVSLEDLMESQVRQGWHKDLEAEKIRFKGLEAFMKDERFQTFRQYIGLVCSPLHKADLVPDSVLVYGDGPQLTHVIHALSYEHKYVPASTFEGYGESCIKGGFFPFVTQRPQLVLPGAGDRSFAAIMDHELGVGMPAFLLSYVMDNLFRSGGVMNTGYPLKVMLPMGLNEKLTPGFQFLREKIDMNKR